MALGKILVVADEVYILHILDFSLGAEGFEVITDIMMPVLDGYETCRRLKREPETKNIPVVLLTAKGRDVDKRLGYEVGAVDYVVKPFSPNRLIERIQEILGCRK